jgi:Cof subfamily protein (haloacid dehalogenase superfamily)
MIAIDLDDTLLSSGHKTIPERSAQAVRRAKAAGLSVVLCTGRTIKGMRRFHDELGLDTPMITSGGAEVYDADGQILFADRLDPKTVRQVLQFAQEFGVHAQVYVDGELAFRQHNALAAQYERSYGFPGIEIPDLLERKDIVTPKVLFMADPDTILTMQQDAVRRFPELVIKRSMPEYLEFVRPGVNKGVALKFIAAHFGIDLQEVVAVGDSEIDIPMLEAAGLGVAVANASEEAKAAANMVCASNDEGGVADVIEMILREENHENKA